MKQNIKNAIVLGSWAFYKIKEKPSLTRNERRVRKSDKIEQNIKKVYF